MFVLYDLRDARTAEPQRTLSAQLAAMLGAAKKADGEEAWR